ncbi:MAG: hypothetical protein JRC86_00430 [Deltaproteobacteria bacterium]|nr:hypothetical protein [Deltaproteobacteria bacterium]
MTIASGVEKKLVLAPQATKGTEAIQALGTAQFLRRVTSNLDMTKETYESNEINANRQMADMRHGVQSVEGTLNGELSAGTYDLLMAALLRKDFVAGVTSGVNADVTTAVTSGAAGTFTSAATATFLTDGFKVGDVVRCTGHSGGDATNNNDHNCMITAVTELIMTGYMLDGQPFVADAAGDDIDITVVGKKTWVPETAHTEDWFTLEHNFSDLDLSETFWDVKINTMAFKVPATGMSTIDIGLMGLNHTNKEAGESPWFTSVVAASTGGVLASVDGAIFVGGAQIALITSIDFDIAGGLTSEPVVGSNVKPDIFDGRVTVKGTMTVFFQDATMRDYFEDETEVAVNLAITDNDDADAEFIAASMPRVKMGGASKDDGEKGIVQTMPFVALFNTTGGDETGASATDELATTISIQDSTL